MDGTMGWQHPFPEHLTEFRSMVLGVSDKVTLHWVVSNKVAHYEKDEEFEEGH